MTTQERAYVLRLQRRAANTAPDLAAAQLRAFELIRSALPESQVARAIQDGTMDRLISEIIDDRTGGPFAALRARLEGATIAAADNTLPRHDTAIPYRRLPACASAERKERKR